MRRGTMCNSVQPNRVGTSRPNVSLTTVSLSSPVRWSRQCWLNCASTANRNRNTRTTNSRKPLAHSLCSKGLTILSTPHILTVSRAIIEEIKRYPKFADLRDLKVFTPDNKPAQLKDIVVKGKWNFIDFWASWCGPCRAAIPSVKKMYEKMGDRLNIISLSVDKNNTDWQKAMKEEQMPWPQYIVPQTEKKALTDAYYVRYIPTLIAVSPDGKISLYTGDPSEAHDYLEDKLK